MHTQCETHLGLVRGEDSVLLASVALESRGLVPPRVRGCSAKPCYDVRALPTRVACRILVIFCADGDNLFAASISVIRRGTQTQTRHFRRRGLGSRCP
jgi:hypothetical protein